MSAKITRRIATLEASTSPRVTDESDALFRTIAAVLDSGDEVARSALCKLIGNVNGDPQQALTPDEEAVLDAAWANPPEGNRSPLV